MPSQEYYRTVYTAGLYVAANVITLAAIILAMYISHRHPSEAFAVFCTWFFSISVPTWIIAKRLVRYVRRAYADPDEGMVRLPRRRHAELVRWSVGTPLSGVTRTSSFQAS